MLLSASNSPSPSVMAERRMAAVKVSVTCHGLRARYWENARSVGFRRREASLRRLRAHVGRREEALDGLCDLRGALDELRTVYPELIEKIKTEVLDSFDVAEPLASAREILATKAEKLLIALSPIMAHA